MGYSAIMVPLAALVVACADPALVGPPGDPPTGIAVEVRRGPIAPVEREGVDNTAPVRDAQVMVVTASGTLVGRLVTDSLGKASASVSPGDYRVGTTTCPGALRDASPQAVRVAADSVSAVRLVCDTGIR